MNITEKAIKLALKAHERQLDKGGEPYILHVLRIGLKFQFTTPQLFAGALLHDTVEDTLGKPNQIDILHILDEFGLEVALIVNALSRRDKGMLYLPDDLPTYVDSKTIPFTAKVATKQEVYLSEFIPRIAKHPTAKAIKIADIEDNLSPNRVTNLNDDEIGRVVRYVKALKILNGK